MDNWSEADRTPGTRSERRERKRFTPALLESKSPPKVDECGNETSSRKEFRDTESPLWLRITSDGTRSFSVRVRIKGQKQPVRITFDKPAHIDVLSEARTWARRTCDKCRTGVDPRAEKRDLVASQEAQRAADGRHSFEKVARAFLATNGVHKKNARGWKPRTLKEYERAVNGRLIPRWKDRTIHSITRDEVVDYLAEAAETAPVAANRILAVLSGLMNWYQRQRGSGFTSPIVRGMEPTEESARERILSDDELRIVWHVAGKTGTFGRIIRMLLLTAARKSEVGAMRYSQIGTDGIWELSGERTKNHSSLYLPLPHEAFSVIAAQDRVDNQDIVFSVGGKCEFKNWGHSKAEFDKRVLWRLRALARANGEDVLKVGPLPNWRIHDLRRTARSLMARAKVRPDHAERVLNHKIGGIEGTYDRHSYRDDKRVALERLARLIRKIVDGETATVVRLPTRAAAE